MMIGQMDWRTIMLFFGAPLLIAIGISVTWFSWTLALTMFMFYVMGWQGHRYMVLQKGYWRVEAICPIAGAECYTAVANDPPTVAEMVITHLREKHEILPGVTD